MTENSLIANTVWLVHILLVIFIVLTPFVATNEMFLMLHVVGIVSLLVHWKSNNDICCLTTVEGYYRGCEYNEGFLHRFIGPVYNFQQDKSTSYYYLAVIVLMVVSMDNFIKMNGYQRFKHKLALIRGE